MDFKLFLPLLEKAFAKERKSAAGRKAFDPLLMFKILLLQSLYNLSDAQTEYQIKDRLSFMRFLELSLGDTIPDEKTIWVYREALKTTQTLEKIQAYKKYAEEYALRATEKNLPIMLQAKKIFDEEIEILETELKISQAETDRIAKRYVQILSRLKLKTEVMPKPEPISISFRQKNKIDKEKKLNKIKN